MPVAVEQAGNFGAPSKQTKQNNEQRFSESDCASHPDARALLRYFWPRPAAKKYEVPQWAS
jgi:hypothetical protein